MSLLGAVHVLAFKGQRLEVSALGAALRLYEVDGITVSSSPSLAGPLRDIYRGGHGQVLMPWPNRVAGGTYVAEGVTMQLPINEVAKGNASHGFIRQVPFVVESRDEHSMTLVANQGPMPGYPFPYTATMTYLLDDNGLTVRMEGRNDGVRQMPFGMGMHPYFSVGSPTIDDNQLFLAAGTVLEADQRAIPNGKTRSVTGTQYDFTSERAIADTSIDDCYSDLLRDNVGKAHATLSGAERKLNLWFDETFDYLMVFTGDTLSPDVRRTSIAIEPMTCAPDAYNNNLGLRMLEPGELMAGTWGAKLG